MARLALCFVLLATALGHAVQPPAILDKPISTSNLAVLSTPFVGTSDQPLVLQGSRDEPALTASGQGICYKIRAYIFKRDDDHAPQLLGSTTCGPRPPRAKNVIWPKGRLVPAD